MVETWRSWERLLPSWAMLGGLILLAEGLPAQGQTLGPPLAESPSSAAVAEPIPFPSQPMPMPEVLTAPAAESWSLDRLIDYAARSHPELAAARYRVQAAQGRLIQAGLYPNPLMGLRWSEIGDNHNQLGEPGFTITQEIVTKGKLGLARAAAAYGIQVADWQATTRWFDVLTRVRTAYFEVLTAQREVQAAAKIVDLAKRSLDAAVKLEKAGVGSRPDVLRAQVEREQSRNRLVVALQRRQAAGKLLAVAVGDPEFLVPPLAGSLDWPAPSLEWDPLWETMRARSSEIQEAQARVLEAEARVRRAQAERIPNVEITAAPFYSTIDQDMRVNVGVLTRLPLFNRNQGNILAAQADLARSQAEVGLVGLRLTERLAAAYTRYQAAREQGDNFKKKNGILDNARESLRLIEIGYMQGDPKYNYTALLQAQQVLFQAELAYVQVLGELWRALSEIRGLVQDDEPTYRRD